MPKPRKLQISLDATPYYHCTSRCVRRAFLCGNDPQNGRNYEHRRQWVEDRLLQLAEVYCIDICAYAVMSNHLHVILHVNQKAAMQLSAQEICRRWHQIFKGTDLTQKYVRGDKLRNEELEAVLVKVEEWREKMYSVSWFMRSLNEPIARKANAEDDCTGAFWESRFVCQALLDEKALVACMAYVDLNPVRAGISSAPGSSYYTSARRRLLAISAEEPQPKALFPFVGSLPTGSKGDGLPFLLGEYCNLLDWTASFLRKRNQPLNDTPSILQTIGVDPVRWRQLAAAFEAHTQLFVGSEASVRYAAQLLGYQKPPGIAEARAMFR